MFSNLFNALVRWWYNELTAEQALKKLKMIFGTKINQESIFCGMMN